MCDTNFIPSGDPILIGTLVTLSGDDSGSKDFPQANQFGRVIDRWVGEYSVWDALVAYRYAVEFPGFAGAGPTILKAWHNTLRLYEAV